MVTAATPGCISAPHSCRSVGKWTSQGIFIDLSFYTPGYERDKPLLVLIRFLPFLLI